MEIQGNVAVVTGAASGIGRAVCAQLAQGGASAIGLVDRSECVGTVKDEMATEFESLRTVPFVGDVTDASFRAEVFATLREEVGLPRILVPAAGITRDQLAVKLNKQTGRAEIYPVEDFGAILEVNLVAPVYWALQMVAGIAEDRAAKGLKRWSPDEGPQGAIVFIGSVSSQGNKGQIAYAATKAGIEGAAATLMKEAIFFGVRCGVIHPGFTDTPMVRAMGDEHIEKYVLPYTQLRRLVKPEEVADAICFMVRNSAVSGELWADAGWHPTA